MGEIMPGALIAAVPVAIAYALPLTASSPAGPAGRSNSFNVSRHAAKGRRPSIRRSAVAFFGA